MSGDTKRMADTMRATAQCLDIIGPFEEVDRLKIMMTLIVLLGPRGEGEAATAVEQLMERMAKKAGI